MGQIRLRSSVAWLPWGAAAFARAREEQKPVLLSLSAPWSAACREMDRVCYDHGEIADEINRWFVPVRVDVDRRPDVAERYDLGGLPSTVFLTVDGEIIGGGTFVPPERFREALLRVRREAGGNCQLPMPNSQLSTPNSPRDLDHDTAALSARVFATFDREHGGFGGAPKFPLAAPVRLALDLFRETQSDEMAECVTRTLDAMGWGGLYDEADGGFRRCAGREDWSEPQPEKLLSTNAAMLDLYLEAGTTFANERWLARAADVVEFIQRTLAIGPGEGWRASVESDATRFTDVNALAASSLLRAARVFNDPTLEGLALQSLETVVLATYRPGQGVAHCTGGVRGLLTDHVAMISAHLDAWDRTGNVVYQMMAEELARFIERRLRDEARGGFLDRAAGNDDEIGLLASQLRPFELNCEAALALGRLAALSPDSGFDTLAGSALAGAAETAALQGPLAAHYLLAQRSLSR
ncbi:MAG: DUF255 domain-containing protein [Vicinamibacterales bacterium]